MGRVVRSAGSGQATNRLVREGFYKTLCAEIFVPLPRELLVLLVEVGKKNVVLPVSIARNLLDAEVIVSEIECGQPQVAHWRLGQLETHLRVAHQVAVLLAVVRNGD